MSDQTPNEPISDDDLDAVHGAGEREKSDSYANLEVSYLKQPLERGKHSGSAGSHEVE